MKLYATVTSERASKGQGGNKYVYADFSVDHERVGEVELYLSDDGEWNLKFRANELMDWDIIRRGNIDIIETRKGEKQKGEIKASDVCPKCGLLYGDCDD
jgi:hypothetical protein